MIGIATRSGCVALILSLGLLSQGVAQPYYNDQFFQIRRGVNISHWLSQSKKTGAERAAYFTEKDVAWLAKKGFDHLRIPVDEVQLWQEDGQKDVAAFALLHQALGWCKAHKLKAVVDLHILRSHYFDAKVKPLFTDTAAQTRFVRCWQDLSSELNQYPVQEVAYELMNEPVADDPEQWNLIAGRAYRAVRVLEPGRKIIIGSNQWQQTRTFDQLRVPAGDPNIILSFHAYDPFLLTHHAAPWTVIRDYKGPIHYPGLPIAEADMDKLPDSTRKVVEAYNQPYGPEQMQASFDLALKVAARNGNLQLYCGEWGCNVRAPRAERLKWYEDQAGVLEENQIAWAVWDYKGGFQVRGGGGDDELLVELLPPRFR